MNNAPPFFQCGFGRTDIHIPVHLHGIGVNDLAPKGEGQCNGQSGFSTGCGASDENDFWFIIGRHGG